MGKEAVVAEPDGGAALIEKLRLLLIRTDIRRRVHMDRPPVSEEGRGNPLHDCQYLYLRETRRVKKKRNSQRTSDPHGFRSRQALVLDHGTIEDTSGPFPFHQPPEQVLPGLSRRLAFQGWCLNNR